MEAHRRLTAIDSPFPTISFGTGSLVRLPGPSITEPNVYKFNSTSYNAIFEELYSQNPRLYKANGLLTMLDRNRNLKWGPERFQDWQVGQPRLIQSGSLPGQASDRQIDKGAKGVEGGVVDIIFTCEERCWDAVVDDLLNRGSPLNRPVHVFNIEIKDNHEESLVGGNAILELATELNQAAVEEREAWNATGGAISGWDSGGLAARKGFDERVPEILGEWQERWPNLPALWTLAWF
jgi:RNA polymerase II subunit A C-terminal domain phosphatase SSU72